MQGLTYLLHKMSWWTSSHSLWHWRGVVLHDSVFMSGRDCMWLWVEPRKYSWNTDETVQRVELFAPQKSETIYQQIHPILLLLEDTVWEKYRNLFSCFCWFVFSISSVNFINLEFYKEKNQVFPKYYYYAIMPSTPWILNLWFLVKYLLPRF